MKKTHKLTWKQAEEIRFKRKCGATQSWLAREYNVTQAAIWNILNNLAHKTKPLTKQEKLARRREKRRIKNFNINNQQLAQMYEQVNHTCTICGKPPDTRWKTLNIDHDHTTNKVRGLLCTRCNTVLGKVEDSPQLLMKLRDYLIKHGKTY